MSISKKLPDQLAVVIRVLNHQQLLTHTNDVELARLAGFSRKTIGQYQAQIAAYASLAVVPSMTELNQVNKRILQTYIDDAISSHQQSPHQMAAILGAIAGFVLRYELSLIGNVSQRQKVMKVGGAFVGLSASILVRKGNEGTPIHNQNKDAQYLLSGLNKVAFVDQLFKRSNGYLSGHYAKRWSLTPLAHQVVSASVTHLLNFIGNYQSSHSQVTHFTDHIPLLVCSGITVTSHEQPPAPETCHMLVSLDMLGSLSMGSLLLLLNQADFSPYDRYLAVSLANLAQTNHHIGRSYNVLSSLKSDERKALGFINYDMSSAIQIICFGLLYRYSADPELFSRFNLIFQYGFDRDFKRELRQKISADLAMPVDEVKALLTAYANGSSKHSEQHPLLAAFSEDSDLLRREVIALIAQHEPQVLQMALNQTRQIFDDKMDWKSTHRLDDETERKKSSVFFFIWTYYEKQIRDAMLSLTPDGIPVHDAVYSRHSIPLADFEQRIFERTGFEVKVSH